jgi:hypothetical protein
MLPARRIKRGEREKWNRVRKKAEKRKRCYTQKPVFAPQAHVHAHAHAHGYAYV